MVNRQLIMSWTNLERILYVAGHTGGALLVKSNVQSSSGFCDSCCFDSELDLTIVDGLEVLQVK